jgi:prevent-host-death family protein
VLDKPLLADVAPNFLGSGEHLSSRTEVSISASFFAIRSRSVTAGRRGSASGSAPDHSEEIDHAGARDAGRMSGRLSDIRESDIVRIGSTGSQAMGKTISATEAARQFSDLLNRVSVHGERYTIVRRGRVVAHLTPVTAPVTRRLGELPRLLKKLPSLGKDTIAFAREVSRGIHKAPRLPRRVPWE